MSDETITESKPAAEAVADAAHEVATEPEQAPVVAVEPAPAAQDPLTPAEDPAAAKPAPAIEEPVAEESPEESFGDLLRDFERTHTHRAAQNRLEGTVISVSADQVFLDVGYKMEGVLPRSAFENNAEGVKAGDKFPVSITGRNEEHYYVLSRFKVAQPRDWSALEKAFAD